MLGPSALREDLAVSDIDREEILRAAPQPLLSFEMARLGAL